MDSIGAQTSILDYFANPHTVGGRVGIAMVAVAWLCGHWGLGWGSVLVVALFAYSYWFQQTRRMRRAITWGLQNAMRDPIVARQVMGMDLPSWVNLAPVERCTWLQSLVDNMWPFLCGPTQGSLTHSLSPLLERYRPMARLSVLELGYFDLGDIPPRIDGVQVVSTSGDTTVLDMFVTWVGNPDIRIIAGLGSAEVEASLSNLQLRSMVRLTFGPHCRQWPCFANMSMSFVGKPRIDYNLRAAKLPLDAIPGLAGWLDKFIAMGAGTLVYPRRLAWPIVAVPESEGGGRQQEYEVEPVGCLIVSIRKAANLADAKSILNGASFVKVTSTMGDDRRALTYRTRAVKGASPDYEAAHNAACAADGDEGAAAHGGAAPSLGAYDSVAMGSGVLSAIRSMAAIAGGHGPEGGGGPRGGGGDHAADPMQSQFTTSVMQFPVYNVPSERLVIEVLWARNAQTQLMNRLLMQGGSSLVGRIQLYTRTLMVGQYDTVTRLTTDNAGANGNTASTGKRKMAADLGSLSFGTVYRPFVDMALFEDRRLPIPRDSHMHSIGLIVVEVGRASSLRAADVNGLSDPYVVVRVGNRAARTVTIGNCLNPVFNERLYIPVDERCVDVAMGIAERRRTVPSPIRKGKAAAAASSGAGSSGHNNQSSRDVLRGGGGGGDFAALYKSGQPCIDVTVYDEDRFGSHEVLGRLLIPIVDVLGAVDCRLPPPDRGYPLHDEGGKASTRGGPSIMLDVRAKLFAAVD